MSRPLLITDCDEVLLHMVAHFAEWLAEEHGIAFDLDRGDFAGALSDARTGEPVADEQVWPLLEAFFRSEMPRQTLVPGALEALERIAKIADIVILTNLGDDAHGWRVDQLAGHGIHHEVMCNQGGKGRAVSELIGRYGAGAAVFVDDLAVHHASVARHAPDVWRLHMIAEPRLARVLPKAEHAHERIDQWAPASDWIVEHLQG